MGRYGEEDVRRLHRHLIFVEILVLKQLDMFERAFDQRLWTWLAIFFEQVLFEAARVDADADRAAIGLRRAHDLRHARLGPDVARIDPEAGSAGVGRFQRALVVEMDVGDERHGRRADEQMGVTTCRERRWQLVTKPWAAESYKKKTE